MFGTAKFIGQNYWLTLTIDCYKNESYNEFIYLRIIYIYFIWVFILTYLFHSLNKHLIFTFYKEKFRTHIESYILSQIFLEREEIFQTEYILRYFNNFAHMFPIIAALSLLICTQTALNCWKRHLT